MVIVFIVNSILFMGRPNDRYGFIRPPVDNTWDESYGEPEEQWFDQRVDHFNKQDNKTFKQRYFVEDSHYKTGGPVFLMISGESEAGTFWLTNMTYMGEIAPKFGALAVVLEHRYYGKSVPTPDLSTENLKYLSSELALKDTQQFALYLMKKLSLEGSKWVVFGGSYAGNLAAWFREKYPNIAAGAIASSAPVEAVVDFMGYAGVVSESLGKECSDNIRKAFIEMETLLKTPEDVIKLRKTLNMCGTFDGKNINNNRLLAFNLMGTISHAVQYNLHLDVICKIMNDSSVGTPLERCAKVLGVNHTKPCDEVNYNDMIKASRNTTIDPKMMERQWLYQACNEFAYFVTTDLVNNPFGHNVPVEFWVQMCADMYDKQFTAQSIQKSVDRTNAYYGGLKPKVTNVVFPNGSLDPYHALSVLHDLNNSTKAVVIENYSHGGDMWGSTPKDTQSLRNAHKLIEQQIAEYIK
ncbi:unnamed protein product [Medioppia subpectinata]|uniref:Uncharacterized protein n=1 Tax=Medioppia subpectinata TaxID=1979941 RepID=A0A7R9KSJ0_9ACAR|nr:unnamed protein product [Medioppia subpectinata]CAG2108608.1 unnamed protein product [Medioppia subpectinata]